MESKSISTTMEAYRKKEKHENTKEGKALLERLVNEANDH